MAQQLQTTVEAHEADGRVHDEHAPTEDRPMRLQVLIAELLIENQKLRFKVSQLERQTNGLDGMPAKTKE
jgi:hypothetical protein